MKSLNAFQPFGLAILRGALALIFIYHGYPKLVRADAAMREFFVQHGFPGYFVGIAMWKVKIVHGVFAVGEYQFELALAAACVALATVGAGSLSVDHVMLGEGRATRSAARSSKDYS